MRNGKNRYYLAIPHWIIGLLWLCCADSPGGLSLRNIFTFPIVGEGLCALPFFMPIHRRGRPAGGPKPETIVNKGGPQDRPYSGANDASPRRLKSRICMDIAVDFFQLLVNLGAGFGAVQQGPAVGFGDELVLFIADGVLGTGPEIHGQCAQLHLHLHALFFFFLEIHQ